MVNPGVYSVQHSRIILAMTLIFIVGGIYAYKNLGRLEDPEFTIKQALIVTPYPGASP
jgi:multidrug efflux pump subunit AcrB